MPRILPISAIVITDTILDLRLWRERERQRILDKIIWNHWFCMGWLHAQLHPFLKLISLSPGAYGTRYAYFIEGNTCVISFPVASQ